MDTANTILSPNQKTPKVCLNMIVRNESRVIERLLNSVYLFVDEYLICDTGSTDNTKAIITRFFLERKIPGKIIDEPFRDFGYNRSFALAACDTMSTADYVILLDADMVLWVNPQTSPTQFRQLLSQSTAFHILQGTDTFYYKNMRIVKNHGGFKYWGVTHEYVQTPNGTNMVTLPKDVVFIRDIGDGGSKADKFIRDIRLLTKGLEENPNNDRYTFYLANSLKDSGQTEKAVDMYKKRVEIGGWIEEVWYSCYMIGKCYKELGDMPNAIYWWMEGYNKFPQRIENLYEIVKHYRIVGCQYLAYTFYSLADHERKKNPNVEYLFLERDVYDFKLDYELSVLGYYCNRDNHDLAKLSMSVLSKHGADDNTYKSVFSNYKFYTKELIHSAIPISGANLDVLLSIGKGIVKMVDGFVASTPSICFNSENDLVVCQRYVNYHIDDKGNYINREHIETKNVIAVITGLDMEWRIKTEFEMEYDRSLDDRYVGIEDVRLLSMYDSQGKNIIIFNGNRGISESSHNKIVIDDNETYHTSQKMTVEHGSIDIDSQSTKSGFIKYNKSVEIEKNWVLFQNTTFSDRLKCVYNWSPLTIGEVVKTTSAISSVSYALTNVQEQTNIPNVFKYVRGSTNGTVIDNEIWFFTHIVSYEERRVYYHMIVVLDKVTLNLKKYSQLFTFEKKSVEYTLGFVYFESKRQFLIGYSVFDKETKYISTGRHILEDMMIHV